MIRRIAWLVGAIVIMANVGGCGIGYNRVLFGTKTNVGFEVDTKPPVIQLNIARTEGVIAPQFENGKKLPVLASFRFKNSDSFSPNIGSAFATGDAALTLAALYNEGTPPGNWQSRFDLVRDEIDSSLKLDNPPSIQDNAAMLFAEKGSDGEYFQKTDVRPVFFGTDTSLGLKIGWSGAGAFPDSAKLGFNRKELAWVPVSMREKIVDGKTKYHVKTSSLLATIDSAISQPTLVDGAPKMDIQYVQYFATGEAATLLALQQDVRQAMLVRLDPNQEKFAALADADPVAGVFQTAVLSAVWSTLNEMALADDARAVELMDNLDTLASIVPATYEFAPYALSEINELRVRDGPDDFALGDTVIGSGFVKLEEYLGQLVSSRRDLNGALEEVEDGKEFFFLLSAKDDDGKDEKFPVRLEMVSAEGRSVVLGLREELKNMRDLLKAIQGQMANQPALREAAMYVIGQGE